MQVRVQHTVQCTPICAYCTAQIARNFKFHCSMSAYIWIWFEHYLDNSIRNKLRRTSWHTVNLGLTCSIEFGFWSSIMLICWVDRTEWGNIPPWSEESSFRSSSSFCSRHEDARLRLTDLTPATFFCPVDISSLTLLLPKCEMTREWHQLDLNYKTSQN